MLAARGPTLAKIAYEISKSFDFIEIKMISSDFKNNFKLRKSIKFVSGLIIWAPINWKSFLLGAYKTLLGAYFLDCSNLRDFAE